MNPETSSITASGWFSFIRSINGWLAFALGILIFSAIPYTSGFCTQWYFQLAEGYRVSYFYVAEALVFVFVLASSRPLFSLKGFKWFAWGIGLTLLARILSLVFAIESEGLQWLSLARYAETGITLFVLSLLFHQAPARQGFLTGLLVAAVLESVLGFAIMVDTQGLHRGIVSGVPAYQLQLLVFFLVFSLAVYHKKYAVSVALLILVELGLYATQTRSIFLQWLPGSMLVLVWSARHGYLGRAALLMIVVVGAAVLLLMALPKSSNSSSLRYQEMLARVKSKSEQQVSTGDGGTIQWRLFLWDKSLGAFLKQPVTGIGSGGFARQVDHLPQVFDVKLARSDKDTPLSTHNTFLGVLSETGLLGVVAYGFWFFAVLHLLVPVLRHRFLEPQPASVALMLLVFVFSDFWTQQSFLPNMTYLLGWLLGWKISLRADEDHFRA
jgi:O-antigen ligase